MPRACPILVWKTSCVKNASNVPKTEKSHLRSHKAEPGCANGLGHKARSNLNEGLYTRFLTLGLATSSRPIEIKVNDISSSTMMDTGSKIHHHMPRKKAE